MHPFFNKKSKHFKVIKLASIVILPLLTFETASLSQAPNKDQQPVEFKEYSFKTDTLYFTKPNLLRNTSKVPGDLWNIAKAPFQRENLIGLTAVAASTTILLITDQHIINWVRRRSDGMDLNPETSYDVVLKAGTTKIIKIPKNLNTTLYQLGEGGTSMMLATGIWIYGKIKKDWRAVNTANDLAEIFVTLGVGTQIIKRITGRESPFLATRPCGKWAFFPSLNDFEKNTSAYDAFPSGHLSTLMATITVLASNYPEKKWIKPVGFTIMGLSAWAMMNTEVHWAGDYPLAIAIGYLSGKITTWRHRQKPIKTKEIL